MTSYQAGNALSLSACQKGVDSSVAAKQVAAWQLVDAFGSVFTGPFNSDYKKGLCQSTNAAQVNRLAQYYLQHLFEQMRSSDRVEHALVNLRPENVLMFAVTEFLLPPDPRTRPIEFAIWLLLTISGQKEFQPFLSGILKHTPSIDRILVKLLGDVTCLTGYHVSSQPLPCSIMRIWAPQIKYNLSGVENAVEHWLRHRDEFPNLSNALEYAMEAHKMLNDKAKYLSGVSSDGFTYIYNKSKDVILVVNKNGLIETMFEPSNGIKYFYQEINK